MVLSHNDSKPPDKGGTQAHATSNMSSSTQSSKATPVLYSKIHQQRSKVQESLLISAREKDSSPSSQPTGDRSVDDPLVIDTVYWGVSQTPGSLFFDVTNRSDSDKELHKAAYMQLGDFVGLSCLVINDVFIYYFIIDLSPAYVRLYN
ncbi:hypothetical protein G6F46_013455 [Rhizopus delemar]|uniref:Uncharacterized protein n=2 Tax=Rhizopus TaxID=4842 RepID=A0A9P6YIK9_9FUNG|nr:hypothetical protein G6F55_013321 [Rhizopus delemar]KAG1531147.1 hypothetical protein G6F51_013616 [Rhizopus arrhizus]KAG1484374.1 hypothetical protein G6F54_013450 [Rhizopus delemar]KAG1491314.1 hypothetical protein G6F53_013113 [Rhizopus delemar]KAG1491400.1 hypothetical protein G6F52_013478 [Rhizopus delemar]